MRPIFLRRLATSLALGLIVLSLGYAPTAFAADKYEIDPVHSFAVFRIKHLGVGIVFGRFNNISGEFDFAIDDAKSNSISVSIAAASIDTGTNKRDDHLRSDEFFNVEKFPTITFKSNGIVALTDNEFRVSGDVTLLGVTRMLTTSASFVGAKKDQEGKFRAGFETTFSVKRSDFGMTAMPEGIGDEVTITFAVEGIKQQ